MRALVLAVLWGLAAGCSAPAPRTKQPSPPGPPPPEMASETIVCPADVRECPDGSFVARDPDNGCVFRACPGAAPSK